MVTTGTLLQPVDIEQALGKEPGPFDFSKVSR